MALADQLKESGIVAIFVIFVILIIVAIILWIVYKVRRSDLQGVKLTSKVVNLSADDAPYVQSRAKIPATLNGQEFTYSFWVYIVTYAMTSSPKLVFFRGENRAKPSLGNPIVFLEPRTNRMKLKFRTNKVTSAGTIATQGGFVTSTIDYVPLQRWVHVVAVVQDSRISVYLDGELYSVETLYEHVTNDERPLLQGTVGDVVAGYVPTADDAAATEKNDRVNAFVSNMEFFNYALMQTQVSRIYRLGPSNRSWLSWLGFSGYTLRSPFERA